MLVVVLVGAIVGVIYGVRQLELHPADSRGRWRLWWQMVGTVTIIIVGIELVKSLICG